MDHSLKLRVIDSAQVQQSTCALRQSPWEIVEASPIERWIKILPLLPGEPINHYKLRVMNISIPWTRNEIFQKAYLSIDVTLRKKYSLGTTTKLLVCTLETINDKALRDLFISYGAQYLNLFLESLYPLIKDSLMGTIRFYIQCMGRAFYRVNRNSWSIVTDKTKPCNMSICTKNRILY